MKKIFCIYFLFALVLVSCAPGSEQFAQVATIVADSLTQTASPTSVTPVSTPLGFPNALATYKSSSLGIHFSYPEVWYLNELADSKDIFGAPTQVPAILLTSFEPANPPHKLEWTEQTISLQFRGQPIGTRPNSFENWVETHKQAALANQLTISSEEHFLIANQPAVRLILVSGASGIIHQVLTILNNTEFEINIEGNFDLARPVLDTVQPVTSGGLKPPDSDTPAAGICGDDQGDPVVITLGIAPDGLPKAGRCIAVNPAQRIKFINQSDGPLNTAFAEFHVDLPVGGEMLLDKPVGDYLALGVHHLPFGPELWVKTIPIPTLTPVPPVATMQGPFRNYSNTEAGYSLTLPPGWNVDEYGLSNPNKEVLFYPGDAEPLITYLSISLDFRTKNQIEDFYAQNVPDASLEDTVINGYPGIKYTYNWGRVEYFIPYQDRLFLMITDRPRDGNVQQILGSIKFTPVAITIEATMADNGRTFVMNVGDKLRLNLDLSYGWSAFSISDPAVIAGTQDGFFVLEAGTATLTTTGNPECLNLTPPCGMPSVLYSITVIVQ
ncbi:MAG: hypothetical protein HND47_12430 [Chloroflexi bacterium]|nr:hypothetical protein [Chloroflexota bacterium]